MLLGAVVGGALACSGAALQALLGNPLADPHLLGVSAGAAVAGAIALVAGADPVSPIVPLAAFLGALATVAAVFVVARAAGRTSPYAILLVGVVCNALGAAAIMLVNAIASYTQAQGVLFWIMGSLSAQSYGLVAVAGLYALAGRRRAAPARAPSEPAGRGRGGRADAGGRGRGACGARSSSRRPCSSARRSP